MNIACRQPVKWYHSQPSSLEKSDPVTKMNMWALAEQLQRWQVKWEMFVTDGDTMCIQIIDIKWYCHRCQGSIKPRRQRRNTTSDQMLDRVFFKRVNPLWNSRKIKGVTELQMLKQIAFHLSRYQCLGDWLATSHVMCVGFAITLSIITYYV